MDMLSFLHRHILGVKLEGQSRNEIPISLLRTLRQGLFTALALL